VEIRKIGKSVNSSVLQLLLLLILVVVNNFHEEPAAEEENQRGRGDLQAVQIRNILFASSIKSTWAKLGHRGCVLPGWLR